MLGRRNQQEQGEGRVRFARGSALLCPCLVGNPTVGDRLYFKIWNSCGFSSFMYSKSHFEALCFSAMLGLALTNKDF